MTYDAGNRKDVRKLEKAAKLKESARLHYVKRIMSDTEGRGWMHDLLESCFIFGEPFVQGSPDATVYNLGRQNVGKQIFADVVTECPTQYVQMMQEASHKELSNDRHDSDNRSPNGEQPGSPNGGRDPEGPDPSPGYYDPYAREET